nr:hypothetical protein [Tanacetum cinerariifolium]
MSAIILVGLGELMVILGRILEEGAHADPTPVQAPLTAPILRTIPQRLQRLEEEIRGVLEDLGEQRKVMDQMSVDFARFFAWVAGGLGHLFDARGISYHRGAKGHGSVPFQE